MVILNSPIKANKKIFKTYYLYVINSNNSKLQTIEFYRQRIADSKTMSPERFKLGNKLLNTDSKKDLNDKFQWSNYQDPLKNELDEFYLSFDEAMLVDLEKAIKKDLKLQLQKNRL